MLLWLVFAIFMACGLFFSLRLRKKALKKIAEEAGRDVPSADE